MRTHAFLVTAALFALGTDAFPGNGSLAKRNLMMYRRDQLLGGRDHSLMRREDPDGKYELFCDYDNRNVFQWNKVGMGNQLKLESNLFYDEGPCGDGPYGAFGRRTFPEAIHSRIEGYGGWKGCTVGDCEVSWDDDMCKKDKDNAMWLFFLQAISNYAAYMKRLKEEVESGFANASNMIDPIVTDFSTHPKTEPNPGAAALIIISGVLGGLSAVLGPLSATGAAVAGVGGGMMGVGVGVINSVAAANPAEQVQAQLDRTAFLKTSLSKIISAITDSIKHWGQDLIEGKVEPQNDAYDRTWYAAQKRSLPMILSNGDFAENKRDKITSDISQAISTYFAYAALSYTWQQEGVFIVRVSGKVADTPVCDIDMGKLGIGKEEKYCKDGVLYFFHKTKTESTGFHFKLETPNGLGKLKEKLGVSMGGLIDAAVASQKDGGYLRKWTMKDAIARFDNHNSQKMFNIPVCDLDKDWNDHTRGSPEGHMRIYWNLVECANKKDQNGKDFPYKINTNDYR